MQQTITKPVRYKSEQDPRSGPPPARSCLSSLEPEESDSPFPADLRMFSSWKLKLSIISVAINSFLVPCSSFHHLSIPRTGRIPFIQIGATESALCRNDHSRSLSMVYTPPRAGAGATLEELKEQLDRQIAIPSPPSRESPKVGVSYYYLVHSITGQAAYTHLSGSTQPLYFSVRQLATNYWNGAMAIRIFSLESQSINCQQECCR